jgi:hypothetical protein
MNEERIPEKGSNMKVKGKCPRRRLRSRWNNRLGKMSHGEKEGVGALERWR